MLGGKGLAYDMVRAFRLDERRASRRRSLPPSVTGPRSRWVTAMSPITFLQWLGLLEKVEIDLGGQATGRISGRTAFLAGRGGARRL
jgi:hypothetical protein